MFAFKKNKPSGTLISLILLILNLSPAHAVVLKIASISPDGTEWMTQLRRAGNEIKTRTEGRVKFKFYPGGVMGNEQSVLRKIRFGQLQGGLFTAGNLHTVYPDIQIYSLPFLFETPQQVTFVRQKMDPILLEGLKKKGFTSFGMVGAGFAYTMSTTALKTINDFNQHKVWVPAGDKIILSTMKSAGVTPIPLPIADVLTGLQTGMIDIGASTAAGAIAFQWYTVLNHIIEPPIGYIYGLLALDNKAFKKIQPADQVIVSEILQRINQEMENKSWQDSQNAKDALLKQGVTLTSFPPELQTEWKNYAEKAIIEMGKQGEYSPAMLELLQKTLKQYKTSQ